MVGNYLILAYLLDDDISLTILNMPLQRQAYILMGLGPIDLSEWSRAKVYMETYCEIIHNEAVEEMDIGVS